MSKCTCRFVFALNSHAVLQIWVNSVQSVYLSSFSKDMMFWCTRCCRKSDHVGAVRCLGYELDVLRFISQQGQENFLCSKMSAVALGPTRPPI